MRKVFLLTVLSCGVMLAQGGSGSRGFAAEAGAKGFAEGGNGGNEGRGFADGSGTRGGFVSEGGGHGGGILLTQGSGVKGVRGGSDGGGFRAEGGGGGQEGHGFSGGGNGAGIELAEGGGAETQAYALAGETGTRPFSGDGVKGFDGGSLRRSYSRCGRQGRRVLC